MKNIIANKIKKVKVSNFFVAILGAILEQEWTNPRLISIIRTSDDYILGQKENDLGYNEFLCTYSDLKKNLEGIAQVAELTNKEKTYLLSLI
jgi:hypothetical protein